MASVAVDLAVVSTVMAAVAVIISVFLREGQLRQLLWQEFLDVITLDGRDGSLVLRLPLSF